MKLYRLLTNTERCLRLAIAAVVLAYSVASAKVGPIVLEEMFWQSDIVAIGRDVRVFQQNGWQVAEVEVAKTIKGPKHLNKIYYLAEPTWTCDVATALVGENVLVFLQRIQPRVPREGTSDVLPMAPAAHHEAVPTSIEGRPLYAIAHSGRGRMTIDGRKDDAHITLMLVDVILPESLRALAFNLSESEITASIPLAAMDAALGALMGTPPPTPTIASGPIPPM